MGIMMAETTELGSFVSRDIEASMLRRLNEGDRLLLLFGARRVGKTTLVRHLVATQGLKCLELTGDDLSAAAVLSSRDGARLRGYVGGHDLLFVDEAHRIAEIGLGLKILYDSLPGLRIIATGSSALDLASKTKEALTGRAWSFQLGSFSQAELLAAEGRYGLEGQLERDLVFEARGSP
jgi:predicted AAA+ superfamily ATPase